MKIQQMRLDRKQLRPEGRAIPHISNRFKRFLPHPRARNVDPILRNQLLIPCQVDSRHCVLRPITAPSSRRPQNAERTRQQMPSPAHAPLGHELANVAARNRLAPQRHLGIQLHLKSHFAAKVGQHVHVARSFVAKTKVVTLMHLARVQFLFENAFRKLPWRKQGEVPPKRKQQHRIHSGAREQAKFFRSRRKQFHLRLRPQNPRRMRLKRHRHRLRPALPRPRNDLSQHSRVGPVDPIKIPHAQQRRPVIGRNLVEFVKNLHS